MLSGTSDDEAMLQTAVSLAEFGEVGILREPTLNVPRPAGDAVSLYGLGLPLVEVPAVLAAGPVERSLGAGASQSLFALVQVLLVVLAAGAATLLSRELGAPPWGEVVAAVGAVFASPLWAYPAAGYSEPLQAALVTLAAFAAVRAAGPSEPPGWRRTEREPAKRGTARPLLLAAAAGTLAGAAVVVKSLDLVLLPALFLPLVGSRQGRGARERLASVGAAAAGLALPLASWLVLEVVRFGRPFASYAGFGFTTPPLAGLAGLLFLPAKGLVVYFPLVLLSAFGFVGLARAGRRLEAASLAGVFLALLLPASAWWSWDGVVGWGPRLLVPAVPVLAAVAGAAVTSRATRAVAVVLLVLGAAVNALGVFQVESATVRFLAAMPPARLTPAQAARIPTRLQLRGSDGRPAASRHLVAAEDGALSPLRVHLFLLGARLAGGSREAVEARLVDPPWRSERPDAIPRIGELPLYMRTPFRWPHLFSALLADDRSTYRTGWFTAVARQVYRKVEIGEASEAAPLAHELFSIQPSGLTAVLVAEVLRASGRGAELARFVAGLPPSLGGTVGVRIVVALAARDRGDERTARALASEVAARFPTPAFRRLAAEPVAAWPRTLRQVTAGEPRGPVP